MKKIEVKVNGVKVVLNVEFKDVKIDKHDFYGTYTTETYRVWNDELGYEYELERGGAAMGYEYDEYTYGEDAYDDNWELIISEEQQREREESYDLAMEESLCENVEYDFEHLEDDEVWAFLNSSYGYSSMRMKDHNDNIKWMLDDLKEELDIEEEEVGCAYSFNEDVVTEITMKGEHVKYVSDGVEVFKFINSRVIKNYEDNDEWYVDRNDRLQNNYLFACGSKVVKMEERGKDLYVEYEDFIDKLEDVEKVAA